jgi:hypothetical protein
MNVRKELKAAAYKDKLEKALSQASVGSMRHRVAKSLLTPTPKRNAAQAFYASQAKRFALMDAA